MPIAPVEESYLSRADCFFEEEARLQAVRAVILDEAEHLSLTLR